MADETWNKAGRDQFLKAWDRIHAVNRLNVPPKNDPRTVTTWKLVQRIPAEAWPFVYETVAERETLPRNVGAAFLNAFRKWEEEQGVHQPAPEKFNPHLRGRCDGPLGQRISQLRQQGVKGFQAVQMAVREMGGVAGYEQRVR